MPSSFKHSERRVQGKLHPPFSLGTRSPGRCSGKGAQNSVPVVLSLHKDEPLLVYLCPKCSLVSSWQGGRETILPQASWVPVQSDPILTMGSQESLNLQTSVFSPTKWPRAEHEEFASLQLYTKAVIMPISLGTSKVHISLYLLGSPWQLKHDGLMAISTRAQGCQGPSGLGHWARTSGTPDVCGHPPGCAAHSTQCRQQPW